MPVREKSADVGTLRLQNSLILHPSLAIGHNFGALACQAHTDEVCEQWNNASCAGVIHLTQDVRQMVAAGVQRGSPSGYVQQTADTPAHAPAESLWDVVTSFSSGG